MNRQLRIWQVRHARVPHLPSYLWHSSGICFLDACNHMVELEC